MAPTRRPLVLRGALLLAFGLGEGGLFLLVFRVRTSPSRCSRAADRGVRSAGRRDTIVEATLMRERSLWLLPQALTGVAAAGLVLLLPAASALAIFAWWAVVIGLFEAGESLASGPAACSCRSSRWRLACSFSQAPSTIPRCCSSRSRSTASLPAPDGCTPPDPGGSARLRRPVRRGARARHEPAERPRRRSRLRERSRDGHHRCPRDRPGRRKPERGVAANDESGNRGRRRVSAAGESVEWRQARLPRRGRRQRSAAGDHHRDVGETCLQLLQVGLPTGEQPGRRLRVGAIARTHDEGPTTKVH